MTDDPVSRLLQDALLVPVLTIPEVSQAVPLARALVAGGVRMLEVTLRTAAGAESARVIAQEVPDAIVGLGTVTTARELEQVVAHGLRFAFSPGASPSLLQAARALGIAFVPGVQTASELMQTIDAGFLAVKFFPAEPAGGIPALRALAGPFPNARFCPTGGIGEAAIADWLALSNVLAVGGSWLAPAADVAAGRWDAITARASRVMSRLRKT